MHSGPNGTEKTFRRAKGPGRKDTYSEVVMRSDRSFRSERPEYHGHGPGRYRYSPASHVSTAHHRQSGCQHHSGLDPGRGPYGKGPAGYRGADARAAAYVTQ